MWRWIIQIVEEGKVGLSSMSCALGSRKKQISFIMWALWRQTDIMLPDVAYLHLYCSQRGQAESSGQLCLYYSKWSADSWDTQADKISWHPRCSYVHCVDYVCIWMTLYIIVRFLFSAKRKIKMMIPASRVRPTARPTDNMSADKEKRDESKTFNVNSFLAFLCTLHLPRALRLN